MNYVHSPCFVAALVMGELTHIIQGYFTDTGAIMYACSSASEATLKTMEKTYHMNLLTVITNKAKQIKT